MSNQNDRVNAESHSADDYLAAIYEVIEEGEPPNQARLARRLGVSRPAVSEQVARLSKGGLLTTKDRVLSLTVKGRKVAEGTVRKHRMAERFLTDVLGVPWHLAHQEGESFQNGITKEIEQRMMTMLDGPATCPHGNPIPGTGAVMSTDLVALHELPVRSRALLVRLTEDIEIDTAVLRYFEEHGLVPGSELELLERAPDGTISVRVGRKRSSLGSHLADNVWVRDLRRR